MSDYSDTHLMKDLPENFHCKPDKPIAKTPQIVKGFEGIIDYPTEEEIRGFIGHQPEQWQVEKFTLLNALDSLTAGLEHTQTALAEHDENYGRTTRKNKSWAETLESDIRNIEKSIKDLKTIVVSHTTHYP